MKDSPSYSSQSLSLTVLGLCQYLDSISLEFLEIFGVEGGFDVVVFVRSFVIGRIQFSGGLPAG